MPSWATVASNRPSRANMEPCTSPRALDADGLWWVYRSQSSARADDWLLYSHHSPSASSARGLVKGSMFDRTGRLVASVAQEGMVRVRET